MIERHIALSADGIKPVCFKLLRTEGPGEEAPIVLTPFYVDEKGASKFCFVEYHERGLYMNGTSGF